MTTGAQRKKINDLELSILIPCLNERNTVKICINKAKAFLEKNKITGEVLVSDNGSTDGSLEIIKETGARLVITKEKGYGNALINGINHARGKYVLMCDSDGSHDIDNAMPFLIKLREGNDLVVGNRFGNIEKGAMKLSHYIGVKFLTELANIIHGTELRDYHCGLRGGNLKKMKMLECECGGMDFASEMIIKSQKMHYKIAEVSTTMFKDGRGSRSHLRAIPDGIRHLRTIFKLIF